MEVAANSNGQGRKHFVLVHGACHGAWSWYKLKPLLEAAGHRVTALDQAASGTNLKSIYDVYTIKEYTQPLLDLLKDEVQPVVLVGHSLGGVSMALVADMFPEKVSVAVFVAAFVPDTTHKPSYVIEQYVATAPEDNWLDTQFGPYGNGEKQGNSMFFGPMFLLKLYQLCSKEDFELGKILVRPGSLFIDDLSRQPKFSLEGYGSVKRVFIVCKEDKGIPEDFQRWMIQNSGVEHVVEMADTDHMAMLCKPQELCDCLLEIANAYA